MYLLAEAPLAGDFLSELLLVAEEEMVLVVSGLLERKEKIPLGLETPGEEKVLLFSGASPGFWYSWSFSSLVGWTGEHRQSYLWSLPMCWFADTTMKICECKCNSVKTESVWVKEFENLEESAKLVYVATCARQNYGGFAEVQRGTSCRFFFT